MQSLIIDLGLQGGRERDRDRDRDREREHRLLSLGRLHPIREAWHFHSSRYTEKLWTFLLQWTLGYF
jgi:hypothetical protein